MPELPEVQTIVSDLKKTIVDKKIVSFESGFPKAIKSGSAFDFQKSVVGEKIKGVERIGKNILINLNNDTTILVHLKMTGQLIAKREARSAKPAVGKLKPRSQNLEPIEKHLHHCFILSEGSLCFYDVRKFGTLSLIPTAELDDKFSKLGIDPLSKVFTQKKLESLLKKNPTKSIKVFLMEQKFVTGIGNIYASEILFDAKISPLRKNSDLQEKEITKLFISIKKILKKAISMRGTSVSDYRDATGQKGAFQDALCVYKKNSQRCKACGTIIEKIVIGQRSTFYCPHCQR